MPLCHDITLPWTYFLTHWGRVTHICVGNLTIIGSDNGLSPGRRQAIIWTNAGILLIWPLGTNFNDISIEIITFSFKKMRLKVSSAKWRPFCPGLNVLSWNQLFRKFPNKQPVYKWTAEPGATINTLKPRQNGLHFADDIFKRIFLNENIWIPIKISLKFVCKGSINSIPAFVQIMAWRHPGDKPLS